MLLPIASELKTIYFSTGEATEATGSKGTRFSFRTGTDTYSIAAASMPWCVENLGKVWTIIYADYAWGQSTAPGIEGLSSRSAGGKCSPASRCRSIPRISCPISRRFRRYRGHAAGLHRLAVGCVLHAGQKHGARQEDEDVLVVGQHRSDRAGRHSGRGGRRLFLREFPAHAQGQGRRLSQRVQQA